ncbi:hypothetical protein [Nocardia testacea]|uniref:hypothetical protein n=1 Tax=Nocardia testacea TaxID=248551 RepID=UPI0033D3DE0A
MIAGETPQRSGPEATAAPHARAPDTTGRRESSGAHTPGSARDGAGAPPSPPAGGRSGAGDDEPRRRLDLGGPGSPPLRADADSAALTRDSLTAMLRGWSAPGYVDDIAGAVGDVVAHGRGTVRVTAETVGRPDGSRRLGIEVTHTDASEVRTIWELDRTPGTVERVVPKPESAERPEHQPRVVGDDRRNPMWGRAGETVYQDYQQGVGTVRRSLGEQLRDNYPWLTQVQIDNAKLIISELHTNSVTYSPDHRANIEVTAPADDRVRVSISNAMGPGEALKMGDWVPDQQAVERQGGRGTQLAHALSDACGRELRFGTDGSTATHWFELHRGGGADGGGRDPVIDMSGLAADLADLGFGDLSPGRGQGPSGQA